MVPARLAALAAGAQRSSATLLSQGGRRGLGGPDRLGEPLLAGVVDRAALVLGEPRAGDEQRVAQVHDAGVERVRIHFTDLIGVSRNKVVPAALLDELCEDGMNVSAGAFCVDHAGEVVEGNEALADAPEKINEDPYGEGWLVKVKLSDPSEAEGLLSAADYRNLLDS